MRTRESLCHVSHGTVQRPMVLRQIGPPPPTTASPGLHMQYYELRRVRELSQVSCFLLLLTPAIQQHKALRLAFVGKLEQPC